MPLQYRLRAFTKNNVLRFVLGIGNPLEQIQKLVVDDAGDCQEGVITGLPKILNLNTSDVVTVERSTDGGTTWPAIYSGFVVRPGNKRSGKIESIQLLGLSRQFDELESQIQYGLYMDVSGIAREIMTEAFPRAGGTILLGPSGSHIADSSVYVDARSEFNTLQKLFTELSAIVGMRFGVDAERKSFFRYASNVMVLSAKTQGVSVAWQSPDSSKVINAIRWIGAEVQKFRYTFKSNGTPMGNQTSGYVTHLSVNTLSTERLAVGSKEIPSNYQVLQRTQIAAGALKNGQYNGTSTVYPAAPAALTDGNTNTYADYAFPAIGQGLRPEFQLEVPAGSKVFGIRFRFSAADVGFDISIQRLAGAAFTNQDPSGASELFFPESQEIVLFAIPWGETNATRIIINAVPNQNFSGTIRVYEVELITLNTAALDNFARAEYTLTPLEVAQVTVNDIVPHAAFLQLNDTSTGTVTVPIDRLEYVRGLKTIIYAGQPRDSQAAALWGEITAKDQRSTTDAVRFSKLSVLNAGLSAAAISAPVWTSPAPGSNPGRSFLLQGTASPNAVVSLIFSGAITGANSATATASGQFEFQVNDNGSVGSGALLVEAQTPGSSVAPLNLTIPAASGGSGSGSGGTGGSGDFAVGNPGAYPVELWNFDFSAGANGRYRTNGGAWQDFDSWPRNGETNNGILYFQGYPSAPMFSLENAPVGVGRVLRAKLVPGQFWANGPYPRADVILNSNFQGISAMQWGVSYRHEFTLYFSGDLTNPNEMALGMQMHHNQGVGSVPYAMYLTSNGWQFWARESPSAGTFNAAWMQLGILNGANPSVNVPYNCVMEVRHGTAAEGAFLRLWVNGVLKVDIQPSSGRTIGYRYEANAGQLKLATNYDYFNLQNGETNVFLGPVDRLLRGN